MNIPTDEKPRMARRQALIAAAAVLALSLGVTSGLKAQVLKDKNKKDSKNQSSSKSDQGNEHPPAQHHTSQ